MEKGDMVKLIEEKEFCLELLLSVIFYKRFVHEE